MNREKMQLITDRLLTNLAAVRYGQVGIVLKVHDANVISISYETTVCAIEREPKNPVGKKRPEITGLPIRPDEEISCR
ncbi:hypothetical protein FACS189485_12400 [Spirochaetia bacterium]|nr:hypothetical protein FACS189485_12400 [Spirochaetia bacterium]